MDKDQFVGGACWEEEDGWRWGRACREDRARAHADGCKETTSVCMPVWGELFILTLKHKHRGNDLLGEQSCIFPKIFLALSGIPAPTSPSCNSTCRFWKGGAVGNGHTGREEPTSHTVLLCIRVCRHTSQLRHPQHSQWQNL